MGRSRGEADGGQRAEGDAEEGRVRVLALQGVEGQGQIVGRGGGDLHGHVVGEERRVHEEAGTGEDAAEAVEPRVVGAQEVDAGRHEVGAAWLAVGAVAVDPHGAAGRGEPALLARDGARRGVVAGPGAEPAEEGELWSHRLRRGISRVGVDKGPCECDNPRPVDEAGFGA
ncbi:MAG: hypothetical protein IPJ34_40220 [Myxococcales bacterium]|nr:hypothetical protein [Myxococcales bacterium]